MADRGHNLSVRKSAWKDFLICLALLGAVAVGMRCVASKPLQSERNSTAAYLKYGRRIRTGFSYQVRAMCGQNADMIRKFKKGEYAQDRAAFEAETSAFCNSLLESVQQFDGQPVPDILERSHAQISACHRLRFESVEALRKAYGEDGEAQSRMVRLAEKRLKQAWASGSAGVKLHNEIWARTKL